MLVLFGQVSKIVMGVWGRITGLGLEEKMTQHSGFWRQAFLAIVRTGLKVFAGREWRSRYRLLSGEQESFISSEQEGRAIHQCRPGRPRKIRSIIHRPSPRPVCPIPLPQPHPKTPRRTIQRQQLVMDVLYEAWMQGYNSYADLNHYVKSATGHGCSYRTIQRLKQAIQTQPHSTSAQPH